MVTPPHRIKPGLPKDENPRCKSDGGETCAKGFELKVFIAIEPKQQRFSGGWCQS